MTIDELKREYGELLAQFGDAELTLRLVAARRDLLLKRLSDLKRSIEMLGEQKQKEENI